LIGGPKRHFPLHGTLRLTRQIAVSQFRRLVNR